MRQREAKTREIYFFPIRCTFPYNRVIVRPPFLAPPDVPARQHFCFAEKNVPRASFSRQRRVFRCVRCARSAIRAERQETQVDPRPSTLVHCGGVHARIPNTSRPYFQRLRRCVSDCYARCAAECGTEFSRKFRRGGVPESTMASGTSKQRQVILPGPPALSLTLPL